MKGLFKFFFGIIITVLMLAVIVVVGLFIAFLNPEDNAPIDVYDKMISTDDIISSKISSSLNDMATNEKLELTFNEEDLNKIIYAVIREKVNEKFDPKDGTLDDEKYINSKLALPSNIPLVGGKKLAVKNAYLEINGKSIDLSVTCDAFGILKTKMTVSLKVETTNDSYKIKIDKLKLGKLNLLSSSLSFIYDIVTTNINDSSVNSYFVNNNIPLSFSLKTREFTLTKDDLVILINNLLKEDESTQTFTELISSLANKENSLITFGLFDDTKFGVEIVLTKLKVDEKDVTLNDAIKVPFDQDLFVMNKTQTLLMNSLAQNNNKISFTDIELSRVIYSNTNGYEGFSEEFNVINDTKFSFAILGIDVMIENDKVNIIFIADINGIKTTLVLSCNKETVSNKEINLLVPEKVKLGSGINVSSDFITSLFSTSLGDFGLLKYNENKNAFVLEASIFEDFMKQGGDNTPLEVSKIELVNGGINFFVEIKDSLLKDKVDTVTSLMKDALKDTIDTSSLSYETEEEKAKLEKLEDELNNVKDVLNGSSELTEENVTNLVNAVNELSEENQTALLGMIEDNVESDKLKELYNDLFGGE